MSFSDECAQLHPALHRALHRTGEPYTYAVDQWAHYRDQLRIEREPWPFAWTVPSPQYHPHQETQLAQYARPELTILDECTAGGASTIGTTLHATFERYRLGGWP